MKRREFLTAAIAAPAALAGSAALATSEIPKCSASGGEALPQHERHVALIVSPRGPWEPAGADDERIVIKAVHSEVSFGSQAEARDYCRNWNAAEIINRKGFWAIPVAVEFARAPSRFEWCMVAIVSRSQRRNRVSNVFGPLSEDAAESFAEVFNEGDKDRKNSVAVMIDLSCEKLEEAGSRRFQVVTIAFGLDGSPRLHSVEPLLETEDCDEARLFVDGFNSGEIACPKSIWAVVRVVEGAA